MSTEYRKVAFLDTNALHFVDLYLISTRSNRPGPARLSRAS